MKKYTAAQARQHFAEILERVELGESIAVTRHGKWVATITKRERKIAPPGWAIKAGWSGRIAPNFDETPEEFADHS